MKNELSKEFNFLKETLEIMPKNNKKNKAKYLEYLNDKLEHYQSLEKDVLKEINIRANKFYESSNFISFDNVLLDKIKEEIELQNEWNTPYEKSKLDYYIYEIIHFYKDDFTNLNEDISKAIQIFSKVGVKLEKKDFKYGPYTSIYMECFLENIDNIKSNKLQKCFNEIYWKCPNIIFYIGLNFKYLYYYYEKKFIKYYINKKNTSLELKNTYLEKYNQAKENKIKTKGNIINLFLKEKLDIKSYSKEKKEEYINNFLDKEKYINTFFDKEDNKSIFGLYNCLIEYQFYLEIKLLIDDFIKNYQEKDKEKNIYKNLLKEIKKEEKKLFKEEKKYRFLLKIKKQEKAEMILLKINNLLDDLKEKYYLLDYNKVKEKISLMNDNITYYEILDFLLSYYTYTRKLFEDNMEESTNDEINKAIKDTKDKIISIKYQLLNNITVKEKINIPRVIADRYRLINYKITDTDINSNLSNFIDIILKLQIIEYMEELNLDYGDILFLVNVNKLGIIQLPSN